MIAAPHGYLRLNGGAPAERHGRTGFASAMTAASSELKLEREVQRNLAGTWQRRKLEQARPPARQSELLLVLVVDWLVRHAKQSLVPQLQPGLCCMST